MSIPFHSLLKIELITITKMSHLLRLALKKRLRKLGNGLFFVGCTDEGGWVLVLQSTPWDIPLLERPRAASTSRGGLNPETLFTWSVSLFVFFTYYSTQLYSESAKQLIHSVMLTPIAPW